MTENQRLNTVNAIPLPSTFPLSKECAILATLQRNDTIEFIQFPFSMNEEFIEAQENKIQKKTKKIHQVKRVFKPESNLALKLKEKAIQRLAIERVQLFTKQSGYMQVDNLW